MDGTVYSGRGHSSGPIERATRDYVDTLPDLPEHGRVLAEVAFGLAKQLDLDTAPSVAAIAREMRATMAALAAVAPPPREVSRVDELAARRAAHVAERASGT